ncbi:BON domain-containing protein [Singulisphaera rosea]
MIRKYGTIAGAVCGLAILAGVSLAQEPKGTGSSVGEKVDNAVQSLKKGARDAGDAVRDQYNKMRTSVHDMNVSARIYGRLHWDKALADAKIDIDVRKDGMTTLSGTVPDLKAKAKAVDLTRDTVGVSEVVDRLTVAPTPTPVDSTSSSKTP